MKITKNQLRRIIREEKARLNEVGGFNLADDEAYMNAITDFADRLGPIIAEMLKLGLTPEDVDEAWEIAKGDHL